MISSDTLSKVIGLIIRIVTINVIAYILFNVARVSSCYWLIALLVLKSTSVVCSGLQKRNFLFGSITNPFYVIVSDRADTKKNYCEKLKIILYRGFGFMYSVIYQLIPFAAVGMTASLIISEPESILYLSLKISSSGDTEKLQPANSFDYLRWSWIRGPNPPTVYFLQIYLVIRWILLLRASRFYWQFVARSSFDLCVVGVIEYVVYMSTSGEQNDVFMKFWKSLQSLEIRLFIISIIHTFIERKFQKSISHGLTIAEPGEMYLARIDDARLMFIQIVERWNDSVKLKIKGLELQPTSCHAVEASKVSAILQNSGIQRIINTDWVSTLHVVVLAIQPLVSYADGICYAESNSVLTGVLDHPYNIERLVSIYIKILIWKILNVGDKNQQWTIKYNPQILKKQRKIFPLEWFNYLESIGHEVANTVDSTYFVDFVVTCYSITFGLGLYTKEPTNLTSSEIFKIYQGHFPETPELDSLRNNFQFLFELFSESFRTAVFFVYETSILLEEIDSFENLLERITVYERSWKFLIAPQTNDPLANERWNQVIEVGKHNVFALHVTGTDVLKARILKLSEVEMHVGTLNSDCAKGIWANMIFELMFLTNDDDERNSIQAHQLLFRNLMTQCADPPLGYPIFIAEKTLESSPLKYLTFSDSEHEDTDFRGIHQKICQLLIALRTPVTVLGSEEERALWEKQTKQRQLHLLELTKTEAHKKLFEEKYDLAIPAALQALRFSMDVYGQNSIELVPSYLLLGEASIGLKQYKQSEDYLSLAKWAVLKAEKCENKIRSQLHRNFGMLYASQGNYEEALKQLALDIYYSSLLKGPEDIVVTGGYFQLACVFEKQDRKEQATSVFDKIVAIWKDTLKKDMIELDEAQEAEAIQLLNYIYQYRLHSGKSPLSIAEVRFVLGLLYHACNDKDRAKECASQALECNILKIFKKRKCILIFSHQIMSQQLEESTP
ncbi:Zinc finger MYND domain-containing protein 12 [Nowakowskiella sp. JEL0407]|nr:Zinc finger MYND domain-containing protein 12 [Nowakowskiella sp. JEL0407]